ncbi:MAG: HNH endonuclease [Clostridiales bacterium]|nr:HNH endonuclease [Clostridiales bacterium]
MEKKCVVCGKTFTAKRSFAKYCCKVCANHSRFNRTLNQIRYENDNIRYSILELYNSGLNDREIAEKLEKSVSWIHKNRSRLGLPKQLTKLQRQVLQYRQQGLCSVEIADILKMDCKNVKRVAEKIGMPFSKEEIERSILLGKEKSVLNQYGSTEERVKHNIGFITEKHPGFEYISGWISSDNQMQLRCKCCGNVIVKSAITVRSKEHLQCPFCEEKRIEQKREDARLQKEKHRRETQRKKEQKFWNQSFEQGAVSFCPICGSVFYGNRKYCSEECARRVLNSRNKDRRVRKLRDRQIDGDITLQALFDRDGGKCWICGGMCDYDDYHRDYNNNFIVGANYPSIDHVYPLSKGGLHSWDNVKLAHHYCNIIKSNKVVSL